MDGPSHLTRNVAVGGQPTLEDLRLLQARGFVAVVNLRDDGEADQPLPPQAEGAAVQVLGLRYHHIPVVLAELDPGRLCQLRTAIGAASGPVFVHCGAGQRACAMALLATSEGMPVPVDDLLARAAALGFPVRDPKLASFVSEQIERERQRVLQAI